MVKSVDPDGTTAVTENKKHPVDVVTPVNPDLPEEGVEEGGGDTLGEVTTAAPVLLPNSTGNYNDFSSAHAGSKPTGRTHRCLRHHHF